MNRRPRVLLAVVIVASVFSAFFAVWPAFADAAEQAVAPERNPPGDISDSQVFISYAGPGFSMQVPEGGPWLARQRDIYKGSPLSSASLAYLDGSHAWMARTAPPSLAGTLTWIKFGGARLPQFRSATSHSPASGYFQLRSAGVCEHQLLRAHSQRACSGHAKWRNWQLTRQ